MNILVGTYDTGHYVCRPDTTWERESRDLFSPDCVNEWMWSPVVFARICKAGKCISPKFTSRYFDAVGFGILLYIGDMMADERTGLAASSCIDHSSLLPFPLIAKDEYERRTKDIFEVSIDGKRIFSHLSDEDTESLVMKDICGASELTSLRIGDLVVSELAKPSHLLSREDGEGKLKASFGTDTLIDIAIRF